MRPRVLSTIVDRLLVAELLRIIIPFVVHVFVPALLSYENFRPLLNCRHVSKNLFGST